MKRVRNPDAVCMHAFNEWVERMEGGGVHVIVCGVRDDLYNAMLRTGFNMQQSEVYREQKVKFTSTQMAVQRAYELLGEDLCETCPRRDAGQTELYFQVRSAQDAVAHRGQAMYHFSTGLLSAAMPRLSLASAISRTRPSLYTSSMRSVVVS